MNTQIRLPRNQKQIEHEGFYDGSQGCSPDEAISELDSKFNQKKELVSQKATPRIKQLEAVVLDARKRQPMAQQRLDSITGRHAGHLPEIVIPAVAVAVGVFCMLAEAAMLGPALDMFNITTPVWQHVGGLAIACGCAFLLHLSIESLTPGRYERNKEKLLRTVGVLCLVGLAWAGITRGREAAYGASLNGSDLGRFLGGNALLTLILYTIATIGLPVMAAVTISFGMKAAREWREYLVARRHVGQLQTLSTRATKALESEQKKLDHELTHIEETKREWQNAYLVQHQRGDATGARQVPKWMVWVKSAFVAMLVLLLTLPFRSMVVVPVVATIAAFLGAYMFFYRARVSPKPRQLYRQQNVQFRDRDGGEP